MKNNNLLRRKWSAVKKPVFEATIGWEKEIEDAKKDREGKPGLLKRKKMGFFEIVDKYIVGCLRFFSPTV